MRIYIDTNECLGYNGRVLAVCPNVGIEVEVGEGYKIDKLQALKADLVTMLAERLPGCIGEGG